VPDEKRTAFGPIVCERCHIYPQLTDSNWCAQCAGKDDDHHYPDRYPPGTHWATDAAWEILDSIKPGVISDDVRAFLAGQIAGRLMREREATFAR
jgi:hypothetical protein